jgi:lysophospholipase L1-like esterase
MKRETVTGIAGLMIISAGIVFNEWILVALFSSDGDIAGPHRIVIWIVYLGLISTGVMLLIFYKFVTREALLVISGLLSILAGILFIGKFFFIVLGPLMDSQNRLFLRVVEVYFIITGFMLILYRKSIDFKSILLFGISSLLCFTIFLGYDYYRFYSKIIKYRSAVYDHQDKNSPNRLYVMDDKLGWKLIANRSARISVLGEFDVTYEIDANGFKKINNSKEKPDFRIYFFGDSFTFGERVNNEDTFTNIIKEKYLKKEINVYNAGVSGYGIVQMFQRFLLLKDQIKSGDLVIFTPIAIDIERNLKDFFLPYRQKFTNIMMLENFPFFDKGVITSRKMENNFYNKLKLSAIGARYTGFIFRSIRNRFIPDTTKESQEMIKIIERETKLKGGRFVLFFLPVPEECTNGKYSVDISGFNYFDIKHFFPSEEKEIYKLRISKENVHYNIRGHEIIAKAIVETLKNERIIDGRYLR